MKLREAYIERSTQKNRITMYAKGNGCSPEILSFRHVEARFAIVVD